MKTLFSLFVGLCLFVTPLTLVAQVEYTPMLKDGRSWHVVRTAAWDFEEQFGTIVYTVVGDVVVDGKTYKQMKKEQCQKDNKDERTSTTFFLALEEDGKIYHCGTDGSKRYLILDFCLKSGDDMVVTAIHEDGVSTEECTIGKVVEDYIKVKGRMYRRLTVVNEKNINWVEGIGSHRDNLKTNYIVASLPYFLVACYDGDECIFEHEDFFITPLPIGSLGIDAAQGSMQNIQSPAYDLQGCKLDGKPQRGVYVRDGRKVVVK